MSDMTRKDFVTLTFKVIGSAAATAALSACPSFSDGVLSFEKNDTPPVDAAGPDAPAGCSATDPKTVVQTNHTHAPHKLVIPRADIATAIAMNISMTYHIQGAANHDHTVTFTPAQLMALQAGVVPGMGDAGLGLIEDVSTLPLDGTTYSHTHVCTAVC